MHGNSRESALGYVSGIIDGEGAIFITRDHYTTKNPVYRVEIRIGMTDRRALDFMVSALGVGKVSEEKPYHHRKIMYRLIYQNRNVVKTVLDQIYPYLLVKKSQALLAYEFIEKASGICGTPLSTEKLELRRSMWLKMRELNGIAEPATTERRGRRGRDKGLAGVSNSLNS